MPRDNEAEWRAKAKEKLQSLTIATLEAYQKDKLTAIDIVRNKTETQWTFTSALFFSSVVMTTVGKSKIGFSNRSSIL